jgi:hypothetical protein
MALLADYKGIENREELFIDAPPDRGPGKVLAPVHETVVLLSMAVGLNEITAKNAHEWLVRLKALEKLHGAFLRRDDGTERPLGQADIKRLTGLKVNVTALTRKQFLRNCQAVLEREAEDEARRCEKRCQEEQSAVTKV